jgi:hypothetical protein
MHNMGLEWTLTNEEKLAIHAEARRRQSVNEAKKLRGRNNGPATGPESLRVHILGAGGEMAVASFLGMKDKVFGDVVAKRGSCDLPPDIDVKTRARHYYDLTCQFDELPSKTLVLVTVENKQVILHGWAKAHEAMQEKWKREYVKGRACYFLPKEHLRPIQSLKNYINDDLLF